MLCLKASDSLGPKVEPAGVTANTQRASLVEVLSSDFKYAVKHHAIILIEQCRVCMTSQGPGGRQDLLVGVGDFPRLLRRERVVHVLQRKRAARLYPFVELFILHLATVRRRLVVVLFRHV